MSICLKYILIIEAQIYHSVWTSQFLGYPRSDVISAQNCQPKREFSCFSFSAVKYVFETDFNNLITHQ